MNRSVTYRFTAGVVDRATNKWHLPPRHHAAATLSIGRDWLSQWAAEWAGVPAPPDLISLEGQLGDAWNDDLGLSEVSFDINALGPDSPQFLRMTILAHD